MLLLPVVTSILKSLALLSDATRVRILALLRHEELSVAELQEILALGQSNISAQLARLKEADLVTDRRSGKNRLYKLSPPAPKDRETHEHLLVLLEAAADELREAKRDITALNNGTVSAAISFLRTLLFQVVSILTLPLIINVDGIWLAVVAAEAMALVCTGGFVVRGRKRYGYL